MKANKEDLARLDEFLKELIAIDVSTTSDDLKQRVAELSSCVGCTRYSLTTHSIHGEQKSQANRG
jgi:hypothetical protein